MQSQSSHASFTLLFEHVNSAASYQSGRALVIIFLSKLRKHDLEDNCTAWGLSKQTISYRGFRPRWTPIKADSQQRASHGFAQPPSRAQLSFLRWPFWRRTPVCLEMFWGYHRWAVVPLRRCKEHPDNFICTVQSEDYLFIVGVTAHAGQLSKRLNSNLKSPIKAARAVPQQCPQGAHFEFSLVCKAACGDFLRRNARDEIFKPFAIEPDLCWVAAKIDSWKSPTAEHGVMSVCLRVETSFCMTVGRRRNWIRMHAIPRKFRDRAISTGTRMNSGEKSFLFDVANQDILEVPRPYPQRSLSNRSKSRWAWFEVRGEMYFQSVFYQANKPRRGTVSAAGTQNLLSKVVSLGAVRAKSTCTPLDETALQTPTTSTSRNSSSLVSICCLVFTRHGTLISGDYRKNLEFFRSLHRFWSIFYDSLSSPLWFSFCWTSKLSENVLLATCNSTQILTKCGVNASSQKTLYFIKFSWTAKALLNFVWESLKKSFFALRCITNMWTCVERIFLHQLETLGAWNNFWQSFTSFETIKWKRQPSERSVFSFIRCCKKFRARAFHFCRDGRKLWAGRASPGLFFYWQKNQHGGCTDTTHLVTCKHTHRFCPQPILLCSTGHDK